MHVVVSVPHGVGVDYSTTARETRDQVDLFLGQRDSSASTGHDTLNQNVPAVPERWRGGGGKAA